MYIGLNFPFQDTELGGIIKGSKTTLESIHSNLFAFFTLRKGQRPMHNDLYSPLYDFIFEQWDAISEEELAEAIEDKLQKFFPMVKLEELILDLEEDTNLLNVNISYSVPSMGGATRTVGLQFNTNNN